MSVKKSPKIQKLVVNAIRKLQDVQGSTPQEISNYISQEYDVPNTKIQRQVRLALARAVSYGILQRSKGGYYTCNRELIGATKRPFEDAQPMERCGCAPRRGRARASGGGKSRRRKRGGGGGGGSCKRPARRSRKRAACGGGGGGGGGRKARRSSRRARSRGGCGGGGGRKARRRRAARSGKSRCGGGGGAPRRKRARRPRRAGKQCGTDGKRRGKIDQDFLSSASRRRRARSISNVRNENRSDSPASLSASDEERPDEKHSPNENIESPENLLD